MNTDLDFRAGHTFYVAGKHETAPSIADARTSRDEQWHFTCHVLTCVLLRLSPGVVGTRQISSRSVAKFVQFRHVVWTVCQSRFGLYDLNSNRGGRALAVINPSLEFCVEQDTLPSPDCTAIGLLKGAALKAAKLRYFL